MDVGLARRRLVGGFSRGPHRVVPPQGAHRHIYCRRNRGNRAALVDGHRGRLPVDDWRHRCGRAACTGDRRGHPCRWRLSSCVCQPWRGLLHLQRRRPRDSRDPARMSRPDPERRDRRSRRHPATHVDAFAGDPTVFTVSMQSQHNYPSSSRAAPSTSGCRTG